MGSVWISTARTPIRPLAGEVPRIALSQTPGSTLKTIRRPESKFPCYLCGGLGIRNRLRQPGAGRTPPDCRDPQSRLKQGRLIPSGWLNGAVVTIRDGVPGKPFDVSRRDSRPGHRRGREENRACPRAPGARPVEAWHKKLRTKRQEALVAGRICDRTARDLASP